MSWVSNPFFTSDAESYSSTNIVNYVRASTTFSVLRKRNRPPSVIDVNAGTCMELSKLSMVANKFWVRPCLSQPTPPPTAWPLHQTKTAKERDMAKVVQSKNKGAQQVHRTTLRTELDVFVDPSSSDSFPGCGFSPNFLKYVPHEWILSCRVHRNLCSEALEELYKTSPLPATHMQWAPSPGCCLLEWVVCSLYAGTSMAMSEQCSAGSNVVSPWRLLGAENENWSGTATGLWTCIFAAWKAEVVYRGYTILHGLADYKRPPGNEGGPNYFLHTTISLGR